MKAQRLLSLSVPSVLAACLWALPAASAPSPLIFSQQSDGQSGFGPSQVWPATGVNSEMADDFNVIGDIDRVVASGFVWGTPGYQGVYVRFYQYGANGQPGALQQQYFVPGTTNPGDIDVALSPPFHATGKHFLAVQPVTDYWYPWSSSSGAAKGTAFFFRDLAAGQTAWQHGDNLNTQQNADTTFSLYGTVTGAGQITSLNPATVARSGFLEVLGSNFGGSGTVKIDGLPAFVADWQSTRIVAYVPEGAALTNVPVEVISSSGLASNVLNLQVIARTASGRVNWRFRQSGPYGVVRPAIAADGTIYSVDVFGHLYALSPTGALKWLVSGAGNKGVAVGPDGTVYTSSETDIRAYNPDGSLKWTFVQTPRAFINIGVSVGPDGNIYSVASSGMGVFSLTPAGTLRWTNPEPYDRYIVDYSEIVFGPNGSTQQMYFYANHHLRALRLDGTPVFTIPGGIAQLEGAMRPTIGPDGSVHTSLVTYSPNGNVLWSFNTPLPYNVFTQSTVGSDGKHYFVQNLSQLFALNTNGGQIFTKAFTDYLGGPDVNPQNTQLVMGSADTLDHAGFVVSKSALDGSEVWRVTLPPEDPTVWNAYLGIWGWNQFIDSQTRFTPDGSTAYLLTATATGDNATSRSFVHSLDASATTAPVPTQLRSASITLTGQVQGAKAKITAVVAVKDEFGAAVPGVTVSVNWTAPNGTILPRTAVTAANGNATFTATGPRGTYKLTVTGLSKTGYTFDTAHSVLTKSITK